MARRIKLSGHHLCLLVLDGDAYEKATAKGHDLRDLVKAYKGEDLKPPRLCHITRDPVLGLGMNFTPVGGKTTCGTHVFKDCAGFFSFVHFAT